MAPGNCSKRSAKFVSCTPPEASEDLARIAGSAEPKSAFAVGGVSDALTQLTQLTQIGAVVRGSPRNWLGWYDARGCFPLLSEAVVVPFKANAERRHRIPKQRHRATNSAAYDAALRQRGSLTVWFSDAAIAA